MDKSQLAVATYDKIAHVYSSNYFDDVSDRPYIQKMLDKLPQGAKILDVGCGPGQFTRFMMEQGFDVIGIDLSQKMLEVARQQVPEGEFLYQDMRHLGFPDETFDGILVSYSLIHISSEDIPQTLVGFWRVLKPGGYLKVLTQQGEADQVVEEPFLPDENMFFNFFTS